MSLESIITQEEETRRSQYFHVARVYITQDGELHEQVGQRMCVGWKSGGNIAQNNVG